MHAELMHDPATEPWICSHEGHRIWLRYPEDTIITVGDIAYALSNTCRWGGHCLPKYSVLEHTMHVASLVSREARPYALLHDAHEAYLGDVATPLKRLLPEYQALEQMWQAEILRRFGLPLCEALEQEVKQADKVALATEWRDLMPSEKVGQGWGPSAEPEDEDLPCAFATPFHFRQQWGLALEACGLHPVFQPGVSG